MPRDNLIGEYLRARRERVRPEDGIWVAAQSPRSAPERCCRSREGEAAFGLVAARWVGRMPEAELILRSAYRAFNARDIEAVVELMHAEVDWPTAWEGGRVVGRAAVRDYWRRQFAAISSNVEPEGFTERSDGSVTVDVHQVVQDAHSGELMSDSRVRHRYRFAGGLIVRMDVLEPPGRR